VSHKPAPAPVEYKVDDQEILMGFYKKLMWDWMVPRIPASITPNSITIFGQAAALLAVVFAWIAVNGTPIGYLISSFLLLTYLTCDNVDGPHARRTGRSSPLGEFLDHGLDGIASGAVLVTTALVLRIDAIPMVLLCALGAAGFILVFWEQFRTGHLVIPKFSSTEGVTFLILVMLCQLALGDPAWLSFTTATVNVATIIVAIALVGYAAAMAPPIVRAGQRGVSALELLPICGLAATFAVYPIVGGSPIIPAIAAGIFGADVVCRMIVMRHEGDTGSILSPLHALLLAPVVAAIAAPAAWTVTGWSTLGLIFMSGLYSRTLYRGISGLLARAGDRAEVMSR